VINKGYALIAFISEVDISPLSNSISDESRIPLHRDLVIMMRRWRRRTMNYTEDFQISDPFSEGFLVLKFK